MTVQFYLSVQEHTKCQEIELEQAETMRVLIDKLGERFGEDFRQYLLADETCFFLINGKSLLSIGGMNAPLQPNDKIQILPVVEAG